MAGEDLDGVVDELVVFLERTGHALEDSSNVGEVGSTTTEDEDLAVGVRNAMSGELNYAYFQKRPLSMQEEPLTDRFK